MRLTKYSIQTVISRYSRFNDVICNAEKRKRIKKKNLNQGFDLGSYWRRRRDSNPRTACDGYTISSRAPSTRLGDSSRCLSAVVGRLPCRMCGIGVAPLPTVAIARKRNFPELGGSWMRWETKPRYPTVLPRVYPPETQ